jgi:DNA-binding response OmpR family regulator
MEQERSHVFVLEDEEDLAFLLRQNLEKEGYEVTTSGTLAGAREALKGLEPAVLLLDVNLPDGSGFDLLSELRREQVWTPAVFLTARSEEADRLLGFAVGGDDYVVKPFSMAELMARLSAIVRRSRQGDAAEARFPGFRVDFQRYLLHKEGAPEPLPLTYLESELLRHLIERPNQPVSRNEILNEVWGYDRFPTTRTVDTHMLNLRKKLEQDPKNPRHLLTVHGVGYKFVP